MKVVSLSAGGPRRVEWDGGTVLTSIFKTPTDRRLRVSTLNIEGDQQSDLTVHGGPEKAVYAYPSEHYPAWQRDLPDADLAGAASRKISGIASHALQLKETGHGPATQGQDRDRHRLDGGDRTVDRGGARPRGGEGLRHGT